MMLIAGNYTEATKGNTGIEIHLDEYNLVPVSLFACPIIFTQFHLIKAGLSCEIRAQNMFLKLSSNPKLINQCGCVTFQED